MVENTFKVNKKQWKRWSPQARRVFNYVYDWMNENQDLFKHPKGIEQTDEHWETTAFNAAWAAADGVMTQ